VKKGTHLSEETKKKISEARKGITCFWKGKQRPDWARRKIHLGHHHSPQAKAKMRAAKIGTHWTPERRKEWAERHRGEKSHFWRGGTTAQGIIIRGSHRYQEWRKAVFERDKYTCQAEACAGRGGRLNAHHIKAFSKYPALRFHVANGITLCEPCHRKTDSHGFKKGCTPWNKTIEAA
jgi:hypothetical protein